MGPPKASKLLFVDGSMAFGVHKLLKQFSTLYRSKMENFAKRFFDTVTTYNDEICYVKHVLAPFYVFFTLFGCLGGDGSQCYKIMPITIVAWSGPFLCCPRSVFLEDLSSFFMKHVLH